MSDKQLIWKYLNHEFSDSHPAIYQYVMGGPKSTIACVIRLTNSCLSVFHPCMSDEFIEKTCTEYLEIKKSRADEGLFTPKSIY